MKYRFQPALVIRRVYIIGRFSRGAGQGLCDVGFDYVTMAASSGQITLKLLGEGVWVDWFLDASSAAGVECLFLLICHSV